MSRMKTLEVFERNDCDTGYISSQTIWDGDAEKFTVVNLSECPEDAIIERDLFNAKDYLEAVKYGIELAKNGYTDVELEKIEEE